MNLTQNRKFICFRTRKNPTQRLICFPPAGAGASFYSKWHRRVRDSIEVWAAQLPGREFANDQVVPDHVDELVDLFVSDIGALVDMPFEIYGHSFGAAIGFLVCIRLEKLGVLPKKLNIASRVPANHRYKNIISGLGDAELISYLADLGGFDRNFFPNQGSLNKYLALVRKDLRLNESLKNNLVPISTPIRIFHAENDVAVPESLAWNWKVLTTKEFIFHSVGGDHFFTNNEDSEFYRIVSSIA